MTTLMAAETAEAGARLAEALGANAHAISALAARLKALDPPMLATNARGSSDHAAAFAKFLVERELGLPCASIGPSIASLYGKRLRLSGAALLSISQSGRSPDIVAMQRAAREAGALTIALVNDDASPLAAGAETALPLHAGAERSVAATKSALLSMALAAAFVADWADDALLTRALSALPGVLSANAPPAPEAVLAPLAAAGSLFVVGRGATLAIASEAALKLKETCAIHAEAFSSAEVLHGPAGIIGAGFPVLAFVPQDEARAGALQTLERLTSFGAAPILVDTEPHAHWPTLIAPRAGHAALDAIAALHAFYGLAEAVSRRRGRDPDAPPHLSKITQTV